MKLEFIFSSLYENALKKVDDPFVLTWEHAEKKIDMLKDFWGKYGGVIVKKMEDVTGLSFKEEKISCYINSVQSFSDPVTLKVYKKDEYTQDTLVHELTHVILSQNQIGQTSAFKKLATDFADERPITRVHILIHAIHQLVYEKIFPERVESIRTFSDDPAYIRSWEIVDKVGPQNVVNTYLDRGARA